MNEIPKLFGILGCAVRGEARDWLSWLPKLFVLFLWTLDSGLWWLSGWLAAVVLCRFTEYKLIPQFMM